MPEDKLTRAERIRLESLNMALNMGALPQNMEAFRLAEQMGRPPIPTEDKMLERAERIEAWLKKAGPASGADA